MDFIKRPETELSAQAQKNLIHIASNPLSVLVGPNNSGKSFILKKLTCSLQGQGTYIGPMRYWNSNLLHFKNPQQFSSRDHFNDVYRSVQDSNNFRDLGAGSTEHSVVELTDYGRSMLTEVMAEILGVRLEVLPTEPANSMSQRFIQCDGHNISFASSGVRLVTSIVAALLNPVHKAAFIDEPELGISPEGQMALASLFFDPARREKYLSHLQTIVIATHSSIFLDRVNCSNNYYIQRTGNKVDAKRATDRTDLNRMHFWLLGNRLDMVNLPEVIVVCEGKTDRKFIQRVAEIKWPKTLISVIEAGNDGRISGIVKMASDLFGGLGVSPYRDRLFIVLDKIHSASAVDSAGRLGVLPENVIVWDQNGIEYYYPARLLAERFGASSPLNLNGDRIEVGTLSSTKNELADFVISRLSAQDTFPEEFTRKFIEKIGQLVAR